MSDLVDHAVAAAQSNREPALQLSGEWNEPNYNKLALGWLPVAHEWSQAIKALDREVDLSQVWAALQSLANTRMDFVRTGRLDRSLTNRFGDEPPPQLSTKPVRLAVLSSCT